MNVWRGRKVSKFQPAASCVEAQSPSDPTGRGRGMDSGLFFHLDGRWSRVVAVIGHDIVAKLPLEQPDTLP